MPISTVADRVAHGWSRGVSPWERAPNELACQGLPITKADRSSKPGRDPNYGLQLMAEGDGAVTRRYLDGSYLAHNPEWHEEHARWKAEQVAKLMERNGIRPVSICDVGCGSGGVLSRLRAQLPHRTRLVGYEPSPEAFGLASSRQGLTVVNGAPWCDDEHFDLMLVMDVFEHVEDYLGFLRRLRAKADRAILHIPLEMTVQSVLRMDPLLDSRRSVGHLHYFSRETALATLVDAGYVIEEEVFTASGLNAPGLGLRQRLAAIPRRAMFSMHKHLAVRLLGGFSLLVLVRPAQPSDAP